METRQEIAGNPKVNSIQPVDLAESRTVQVPPATTSIETKMDPAMAGYLGLPIPNNIRAAVGDR